MSLGHWYCTIILKPVLEKNCTHIFIPAQSPLNINRKETRQKKNIIIKQKSKFFCIFLLNQSKLLSKYPGGPFFFVSKKYRNTVSMIKKIPKIMKIWGINRWTRFWFSFLHCHHCCCCWLCDWPKFLTLKNSHRKFRVSL